MDENKLKQRIVGAIVLVALAVIFIPMLLTGEGDSGMPLFGSNIPPKPANIERVKTLEIKTPQHPPQAEKIVRTPIDEHNVASQTPAAKPVTKSAKASSEEAVQPVSQDEPVTSSNDRDAKAWAVQVGSFSNPNNAMGLRDKLRKQGYKCFVEKVSTSKGEVYRVRVGPEVRRNNAEDLQKELQAKLDLKGLVVAHP